MALEVTTEKSLGNASPLILDGPMVIESLNTSSHLPAFVLGTVIGALAGAVLGTLISPHTRAYLVGLYQLVSRRLSSAERDKLRFELMLQ